MLGIKVLCIALLTLAVTINSAPINDINSSQAQEINNRITRILRLKFAGRINVSKDEALGAVMNAFDKEIKALEEETHVRLDSIDMTEYNNEMNRQLGLAGMTDPNDAKNTNMLALKFHNRSAWNPPTPDEMINEVTRALDREISALENKY